jgi:hypothetical protein
MDILIVYSSKPAIVTNADNLIGVEFAQGETIRFVTWSSSPITWIT